MFMSLNLCWISLFIGTTVQATEPKLLVVSYDAFRYDYFQRECNPYMNRLKHSGSHSDYMINVFVTKTFPNHHSIVTGFYVENHGVIDSEFYNVTTQKKVKFSSDLYNYDRTIIPIWTLNEKHGKRSGSMMWPGSSIEYQNTNLTFVQAFDPSIKWTSRIDTLISWFKDEKTPINFGLLYIEEPDKHGHAIGINNSRFNNILKELDAVTEYLHTKLIDNGLEDVNVIHLSDHGMTNVAYDNIIDLRKYINSKDFEIAGNAPGLHIYPKTNKNMTTLYETLQAVAKKNKNFEVYYRENIPKRYHYSKNNRIGPIFLMAKIGYTFHPLYESIQYYNEEFNIQITNKTEFGVHGYDNMAKEMQPFFFANGPAFLPKCKLKPFNNVDLYPLFCEILQLKNCPQTNGTLDELKNCLTSFAPVEKNIQYDIVLIGIGITMIILLIGAILYRHFKNLQARTRYRMIINVQDAENMWDEK